MRTVHFFATYFEQGNKALTLIQSLLSQTADNWKLTICSNGDESLLSFRDQFQFLWDGDDRITFKVTEENSGYWGALNRKAFIENDLKDDELLVNTSVEDIYIPKTVEYINERKENFIYWDFSHHHFDYKTSMAIAQPRIKKIDWGSYAVLGEYAKSVKMLPLKRSNPKNPKETIEEDPWQSFYGDGLFVEYLFMQMPFISNIRLPKILFIKN